MANASSGIRRRTDGMRCRTLGRRRIFGIAARSLRSGIGLTRLVALHYAPLIVEGVALWLMSFLLLAVLLPRSRRQEERLRCGGENSGPYGCAERIGSCGECCVRGCGERGGDRGAVDKAWYDCGGDGEGLGEADCVRSAHGNYRTE